jgi:hypothetical protein
METKSISRVISRKSQKTDKDIISLLAQNNQTVWELLYDKYAPVMYETIFNITGDEKIARQIFAEAFFELKNARMLSRLSTALCHRLLRKTYQLTLKHLKARGRLPASDNPLSKNYPLIHLLCFELSTLKDSARKSGISEQEIPRMLRKEIERLCNESNRKDRVPRITALRVVR